MNLLLLNAASGSKLEQALEKLTPVRDKILFIKSW